MPWSAGAASGCWRWSTPSPARRWRSRWTRRCPAPEAIVLDNGPELTGRAIGGWPHERGVRLRFIDPGKPTQNGLVESFNGRLREECLDQHWFADLAEAGHTVEAWRLDYNQVRPHSAIGYRTP